MYDHCTPCIVIFSYLIHLLISVVSSSPFFWTRGLSFLPEIGTCLWFIFSNLIFTAFWTSWVSFRHQQQLLKTFVLRALLKFVWKIRDQFFIKLVGFKTSSFSATLKWYRKTMILWFLVNLIQQLSWFK